MNPEEATTKNAKDAKNKGKIIFRDESYRIMGACFQVYKELGCGFLEAVYQECLAMEFRAQVIPFVEKPLLRLEYKGVRHKQTYVPDFLCYDEVVNDHRSQAIHYLKATGKSLALFVNFRHHQKLESERFVHQEFSRISRIS